MDIKTILARLERIEQDAEDNGDDGAAEAVARLRLDIEIDLRREGVELVTV